MAISGITAELLPSDSFASSPLPLDEDGNLEISDPKSMVEQQIIERVFNTDKNAGDEEGQAESGRGIQADTVEISSEAMELYSRTSGEATIETPDGTKIRLSVEQTEFVRIEQTTQTQSSDPLVLDLKGNGIELTDVTQGNGVRFDLNSDGIKEEVSWVASSDGILAYDRNNNHTIDNGTELFGEQNGAANGFAELAKFDLNSDGRIDKNDSIFSDLLVWQDKNQNGISEAGELKTLDDYGITELSYKPDGRTGTAAGNMIDGYSRYRTAAGSGAIGEAWLNYYA